MPAKTWLQRRSKFRHWYRSKRTDLLLELPGHVQHLLIVRLGDDALGGVEIKRSSIDVTCDAGDIAPGHHRKEPGHRHKGDDPEIVQRRRDNNGPDEQYD